MVKKNKNKHRWDEKLVITVMVVAALSILIILSTYISATGKAAFTEGNVVNMLNTQTEGFTGNTNGGTTKCDRICMRAGKTCILAFENELLVPCDKTISGEYACACSSSPRSI